MYRSDTFFVLNPIMVHCTTRCVVLFCCCFCRHPTVLGIQRATIVWHTLSTHWVLEHSQYKGHVMPFCPHAHFSCYIGFLCQIDFLGLYLTIKASHPSNPLQNCCFAPPVTDVEKLWKYCDCSEDQWNKMVLEEVSISLAFCAQEQKKQHHRRLYILSIIFMTQTHLEVRTESFSTDRIMLSLAAIGRAPRLNPQVISLGCFNVRLPKIPDLLYFSTVQTHHTCQYCKSNPSGIYKHTFPVASNSPHSLRILWCKLDIWWTSDDGTWIYTSH